MYQLRFVFHASKHNHEYVLRSSELHLLSMPPALSALRIVTFIKYINVFNKHYMVIVDLLSDDILLSNVVDILNTEFLFIIVQKKYSGLINNMLMHIGHTKLLFLIVSILRIFLFLFYKKEKDRVADVF